MPHDRHGNLLSVGDEVIIQARIKTVTQDEGYCNLGLETLYPMPPYTEPSNLSLNAKQVLLVKPLVESTRPTIETAGTPPPPSVEVIDAS